VNEPIQEKAPKPPGLLPRNVQSWLLIGIALLMLIIMWVTGGKKPAATAKTAVAPTPATAPLEINETKIAELQNRIQQLQREQLVAQNALAQQNRMFTGPSNDSQAAVGPNPSTQPQPQTEDPIQAERKKRAYLSLFASNVALTYRKVAGSAGSGDPVPSGSTVAPSLNSDEAQVAQLLRQMTPPVLPVAVPPPTDSAAKFPSTSAETTHDRNEDAKTPIAAPSGIGAATGKNYILFEGTVLEAALINRLEGQFSGPVECLLTTDTYSHDRQHLLVPAGTKILGETKKVDSFGQTRLAVAFHRLIMPDGYSVSLDQFKGLDQVGDTGLRDQINNHYLRIFGTSLAIGALGAVAEAGTRGALTASGTDQVRQGFAQSTVQSAAQILDRFLNILPTVTIREGHRVKVYLSGDLALPDYNNHKMPSDL
jgi:type IV secretory pathway VirB10-like protein